MKYFSWRSSPVFLEYRIRIHVELHPDPQAYARDYVFTAVQDKLPQREHPGPAPRALSVTTVDTHILLYVSTQPSPSCRINR